MIGSEQTEKGETGEEQSQEHAHNFVSFPAECSQRIRPGRPVKYAYFCEDLQLMCENMLRLRPEISRKQTWLLHHDNAPSITSSITREFLTKGNMTVVPPSLYFSVSPIENKTKRPPF
jgi:hypothetical protein